MSNPYVRVRLDYGDYDLVPWTSELTLDDKLVRAADYDALVARLAEAEDLMQKLVASDGGAHGKTLRAIVDISMYLKRTADNGSGGT